MRKTIQKLVITLLLFCLLVPFTSYAGTWVQDSTKWKVQADDGTYLTNQWYQNTDGKWYYIGADGYMLTSTTTPDGYFVGADGVWTQPTQPSQPTQSQSVPEQHLAPGALSEEEIERRKAEAGMGQEGNGEGEIVREIHGDAEDAKGWNWQ